MSASMTMKMSVSVNISRVIRMNTSTNISVSISAKECISTRIKEERNGEQERATQHLRFYRFVQ